MEKLRLKNVRGESDFPNAGQGDRPWLQQERDPGVQMPSPGSVPGTAVAPISPRPWAGQQEPSHWLCSPTGSEVRQGPVEGQAVTEIGVVAVVLELLQGHAPAFRAELLAPVCKQRGVCEGLGLGLLRLGGSLWRKNG